MKLIDYDKHRTEIRKKITEIGFNSTLTIREEIDKIMELLDSLPADYTETQMTEIDQAYQRVCRELEETRREKEEQEAVICAALYRITTDRISQIQGLLLQYPDDAAGMIGRLDELNMALTECKKWHMGYLEECRSKQGPLSHTL